MKEVGKVVKKNGNIAEVKITRTSACNKCNKNCGLANVSEIDELIVEVEDQIGVTTGQRVKLEIKEGNLVSAALIQYLSPILAMIFGYYFGNQWLLTGSTGEVSGILGSGLFLVISFLLIRVINNKLSPNSDYNPEITGVVNSNSYFLTEN